jgi:hypothetical protein
VRFAVFVVFFVLAAVACTPTEAEYEPSLGDTAEVALALVPADREWMLTAFDLTSATEVAEVDEVPGWLVDLLVQPLAHDGIRLNRNSLRRVVDVWYGASSSLRPLSNVTFVGFVGSGVKLVQGGFDRTELRAQLRALGLAPSTASRADLWVCAAPCTTERITGALFLDRETVVFAVGQQAITGLAAVVSRVTPSVREASGGDLTTLVGRIPEEGVLIKARSCALPGCRASVWYPGGYDAGEALAWTVLYRFVDAESASAALGRIEYEGVPWRYRELVCRGDVTVTQEGRTVTRTTIWQRGDVLLPEADEAPGQPRGGQQTLSWGMRFARCR